MQYSIDLKKNIILCEFTGHLPANAVIQNIMKIKDDPNFHYKLNTIANIQNASLSRGFLEMNMIANFIKTISQDRDDFKLALIAARSNAESAHLYKAISKDGHAKVCFSLNEAEEWVCG